MKSEKGKSMRKLLMIGALMVGVMPTGSQFNISADTEPPCRYCEIEYQACLEKCLGDPACKISCEWERKECPDWWCPPTD